MCTLVLLRRPGAIWPLVLAANRDELASRLHRVFLVGRWMLRSNCVAEFGGSAEKRRHPRKARPVRF